MIRGKGNSMITGREKELQYLNDYYKKPGTQVLVVYGQKGIGKTTLLNHVLNNKENYKVAVIVNDIGEVNIDADLIGADLSFAKLKGTILDK